MTTPVPVPPRQNVAVNVREAAITQSKSGSPQWKLTVDVPFSNFPIPIYIDRAGTEPPKGQHQVVLDPTKLGSDRSGQQHDGSQLWHWYWRCVEFDSTAAAGTPPPPAQSDEQSAAPSVRPTSPTSPSWDETPMKPDHPSKRRSIERQQALSLAVAWSKDSPMIAASEVITIAQEFYNWISQPPSASEPAPEGPEPPSAPISTPQDSGTPPPSETEVALDKAMDSADDDDAQALTAFVFQVWGASTADERRQKVQQALKTADVRGYLKEHGLQATRETLQKAWA